MTTRDEHLAWCKERALEYLPDSPSLALASLFSDLNKHPETANHPAAQVGLMEFALGPVDPNEVRRHIEGYQ